MTKVPDVSELPPREALAAVRSAGLRPVVLGLPTTKAADHGTGYIVAVQDPAPGGELDADERVVLAFETRLLHWGTLDVFRAEKGSPVPGVVGLELEDAIAQVNNAGLIAVIFQPRRAVETLTISRQEPNPGTPVETLWEVALWVD